MKVAFFKGPGTILDKLIRRVTRSPYSHCELLFSDGLLSENGWMFGAMPGEGTRFKQATLKPAEWIFVDLPVTRPQELLALYFCRAENKCGYDYPGVFRYLLPLFTESKEKWFCSEVCTAALQAAGLPLLLTPSRVHPGRLYEALRALRQD